MAKVAMIGAGSLVFCKTLMNDFLAAPALTGSEYCLMALTHKRLDKMHAFVERMIRDNKVNATVYSTTDRREALRDADYVVVMIQVGGVEFAAKGRVTVGGDQHLRVDGHDLVRLAAGDKVIHSSQQVIVGSVIHSHAEDLNRIQAPRPPKPPGPPGRFREPVLSHHVRSPQSRSLFGIFASCALLLSCRTMSLHLELRGICIRHSLSLFG